MNAPVHLHECDDQGFPICRCEVCIEINKRMNMQFVNRMFQQIFCEGTDERLEREEREQDYEEIGGMK